jgi:hypothetical protein
MVASSPISEADLEEEYNDVMAREELDEAAISIYNHLLHSFLSLRLFDFLRGASL